MKTFVGFGFIGELNIWGAAYSGNVVDTDAVLAETGEAKWDYDQCWLDSMELHDGRERLATPNYWALPAVTSLLLNDEQMLKELHDARALKH